MAEKSVYLVSNLVIYPERMRENFKASRNLVFSQRVMLALIEKGMSREEAYRLVQELSMDCWNGNLDFEQLVLTNQVITGLMNSEELERLFNPDYFLRNVNCVFERVLNGG
jgi:adenylosuccinate lyase